LVGRIRYTFRQSTDEFEGVIMSDNINFLLILLLAIVLTSCGGGSGGGGSGGSGDGSGGNDNTNLPQVLNFESPDTFVNGRIYETAVSSVKLSGEFQSQFVATLDCDLPQNFTFTPFLEVEWRNLANNSQGNVAGAIGCVESGTIFGVGVNTFWQTDYLSLELGNNIIEFNTYENGVLIGRDSITIFRNDGVPAAINYVYPQPDSNAVGTNQNILIVFSEAMRVSSLGDTDFIVSDESGNSVSGSRIYNSNSSTWRFAPESELTEDSLYQVTIKKTVEDEGRGGELAQDIVWSFTTLSTVDETGPTVIQQWPGDQCACVPIDSRIMVELNEPIDPEDITDNTISLIDENSNVITGEIIYHGHVLEFITDSSLENNVRYIAELSNDLSDLAGNSAATLFSWEFTTSNLPAAGNWQPLVDLPELLAGVSLIAVESNIYAWGSAGSLNTDKFLAGYKYNTDFTQWTVLTDLLQSGNPVGELGNPSLVWTGTEIILYGGMDGFGNPDNVRGRYNPNDDSWQSMYNYWFDSGLGSFLNILGLADNSSLWTGEKMLLWGGRYDGVGAGGEAVNRGWLYEPLSDSWEITGSLPSVDDSFSLLADNTAPVARYDHQAVWTGDEMIVWGGKDSLQQALDSGGRYNPDTNTWQLISAINEPLASTNIAVSWTGSRMLVWNGGRPDAALLSGEPMRSFQLKIYDPVIDSWITAASGWEPQFVSGFEFYSFWTGTEMAAVGVTAVNNTVSSGLLAQQLTISTWFYNPSTNRWRAGAEQVIPYDLDYRATILSGDIYLVSDVKGYRYSQ
jgi:hypothetical protein